MKQIWKYIIKPNELIHEIPKNGIIRHVDEQFGEICAWVEVDTDAPKEKRHFEVYGTGHPINEGMDINRIYLGSVKLEQGALVFHIFEYIRVNPWSGI